MRLEQKPNKNLEHNNFPQAENYCSRETLCSQGKIYLKIISIIFISIVFVIFALSTLMKYTTLPDLGFENILIEFGLYDYRNSIRIYSSLLLVFFLIFHANYMIHSVGKTKKRTYQREAGLLFGGFILINIFTTYYLAVNVSKVLNSFVYGGKIKADNRLPYASSMYHMHGVEIEYFDFNNTKVIYSPTEEDEELREQLAWQKDEMHRHPTYLTVAFILMILAFYLSDLFAKRTVQKHNKNEETNSLP